MNPVEVYKFGGASVKDAAAIRNVGDILRNPSPRPLAVVISAMGKTTNALEEIIRAHYHQPELLPELVGKLKSYHEEVATSLLADQADALMTDLHDLWVELNWILEEDPHPTYNYHYDQIIVFGELASTKIVSAYLTNQGIAHQWLDARNFIKTDAEYREARILWDLTQAAVDHEVRKALDQHGMIITQGFIGSTVYNESTTLGREGSDYTAAILAYTLDAESVTIWKDVPGIMTGDPKRFEFAQRMDDISYQEAIEMTYYGAKVIHPKTIKPLQNKGIPLFVRPFDHPDQYGTKIGAGTITDLPPIIVVEPNQVLFRISTKDFSFVAEENLKEIFTRIADLRIKVNSMRNTAISFMVCITNDPAKVSQLVTALQDKYDIILHEHIELITVRHADEQTLSMLKAGKEILFEEIYGKTHQFIIKNA
ncbi:MAG: aspartate kinase [Saprospiraceae bacterium]|nr:aspartate kinase [Candidatus Opimibacter iunctus]